LLNLTGKLFVAEVNRQLCLTFCFWKCQSVLVTWSQITWRSTKLPDLLKVWARL